MVLVPVDRPEISVDLTGDISKLKKETFVIKEGVSYRIRIEFIVQREIVHGLKYVQQTYKLGIPGKYDSVKKNTWVDQLSVALFLRECNVLFLVQFLM